MSLTPTKPITLGFTIPYFDLPDVISNRHVNAEQIRGTNGTLVMFICNHCPYVLHVIEQLTLIGKEYIPLGIGMVAISSNDVIQYPEDHPDKMKLFASHYNLPFPYCYDETQEVAMAYDAACTPDFNLFDAEGHCVYRGQLDGSRPGNNVAVTGEHLRQALELVLAGEAIPEKQIPSSGCNIKWKRN